MGKKDRARLGAAQDTLDLRVSALETSLISRLDGLDRENTALKEKVRHLVGVCVTVHFTSRFANLLFVGSILPLVQHRGHAPPADRPT
jgi:hypothetical protein